MTLPHRIAYERWRAAVLPVWARNLQHRAELRFSYPRCADKSLYQQACAELATRRERNARKRQRRARRGK